MILLGADPLSRFLNETAEFEWGVRDCLLRLADWVEFKRGCDPAADLRGTYSNMLGAARIVKDAGGMAHLIDARLSAVGIRRTTIWGRGDIAVLSIANEGTASFGNEVGALLLEGTAALFFQNGLAFPRLNEVKVLAAWRV